MKKTLLSVLFCLVLAAPALRAAGQTVAATPAAQPAKAATYIYVLHLVSRLHDDNAWTDADKQAVSRHFERLKEATASGKVVFAGRTMDSGERAFGIVVFEAADLADAEAWAQADAAVTAGVMTVDTHPFAVVLERKK